MSSESVGRLPFDVKLELRLQLAHQARIVAPRINRLATFVLLSSYRASVRKPAAAQLVLLARIVPAAQKFAARARTLSSYRAAVQENRGFMARYGPKVRVSGMIRRTSTSYRAKRASQLVL